MCAIGLGQSLLFQPKALAELLAHGKTVKHEQNRRPHNENPRY